MKTILVNLNIKLMHGINMKVYFVHYLRRIRPGVMPAAIRAVWSMSIGPCVMAAAGLIRLSVPPNDTARQTSLKLWKITRSR